MARETMRLVDANLDRSGEALRFLDDLARFTLNDQILSSRLREIRHALGEYSARLTVERLSARDVLSDVGAKAPATGRSDLAMLGEANARRAAEALRSLEEAAKLPEMAGKLDSDAFRSLRFQVYAVEKELVPRLTRKLKTDHLAGMWLGVDCDSAYARDAREIVTQAVSGGIRVVAFFGQGGSTAQAFELSGWLREATAGKALLLTNQLELALSSNADGYILQRGGLSVESVRRVLVNDRLVVAVAADAREAGILSNAGTDAIIVESTAGVKTVRATCKAVICPVAVALDPDDNKYLPYCRSGAKALLLNFRDSRVANVVSVSRITREMGKASGGS